MKTARLRIYLIYFCLSIMLTACVSSENHKNMRNTSLENQKVPEWVFRTPHKKGYIYAVGICEKTYFKDDARQYAAEAARAELARTLSIEIRTIMIDISEKEGSYVDEATITSVSSWASSVAMQNSTIEEYWYDEHGIASDGEKRITYALASMQIEESTINLEEKLLTSVKNEKKQIDIKEKAAEILEQLKERSDKE